MEAILFLTTLFAIWGAYLNSMGKVVGFAIWIVTNLIFVLNNIMIEQWAQAFLFFIYTMISINGLNQSRK